MALILAACAERQAEPRLQLPGARGMAAGAGARRGEGAVSRDFAETAKTDSCVAQRPGRGTPGRTAGALP